MKHCAKLLYLFFIFTLFTLSSCVYDFQNNVGASGAVPNRSSGKITSLQALIDKADSGSTIDLSKYSINNYSATINKAVTINAGNKNMNSGSLSVAASGVTLNGLNNAAVVATPSLGNGSLKISGSSLTSLSVLGGGLNSIHLENGTTILKKAIIAKNYDAANPEAEPVRIVMDSTVTIAELTIKSSVVLDSNTSVITHNQLKSVIFVVDDVTSDNNSVSLAVSANVSFNAHSSLAKVKFGDENVVSAQMSVYVVKNENKSKITTNFFKKSFEKLVDKIENLKPETKATFETQCETFCDTTITQDEECVADNLVDTVNVHLIYNDGSDASADFTFPKGKQLDISSQGYSYPGYKVIGWGTSPYGPAVKRVGESISFDTDNETEYTYYFIWEKDEVEYSYDGADVYTFSGTISEISTAWAGSIYCPQFSVLFMLPDTIEALRNGTVTDVKEIDGSSIRPDYQLGVNASFNPIVGNGVWTTNCPGLSVEIKGNKYTLYLSKSIVLQNKTQLKIHGSDIELSERYVTESDTVNLSGYTPYVLALSTPTDITNAVSLWNGYLEKMSPASSCPTNVSQTPFILDVSGTAVVSMADLTSDAIWQPYNITGADIRIKIADVSSDEHFSVIRSALLAHSDKYVSLDLSESTWLTGIPKEAFNGCSNLRQISLPSGIADIGERAFGSCSSLAVVDIRAVYPPVLDVSAFSNCPDEMRICVPYGSLESYQVDANWGNYSSRIYDDYYYEGDVTTSTSTTVVSTTSTTVASDPYPSVVWTFTDSIATLAGGWSGSSSGLHNFKILFMNDTAIAAFKDGTITDPHDLPVGSPAYQTADDIFFGTTIDGATVEDGIYATNTHGLCVEINSNTYTLYMDNGQLKPEEFLSLGQDFPDPSYEQQCSSLNLNGYIPMIVGLSNDSFDSRCVAPLWGGYLFMMSSEGDPTYPHSNDIQPIDWENLGGSSDPINYDATVDLSADGLASWLNNHSDDRRYHIMITDLNPNFTTITSAMVGREKPKICLDFSNSTGLTELPDDTFLTKDGEDRAVENRILIGVILPEGVTNIPSQAFWLCENLEQLHIPSSVTTINGTAFYSCPFTDVTLGSDGTSDYFKIEDGVLYSIDGKKLVLYINKKTEGSFTVPASVEEIGKWAFNTSAVTTITFEEGSNLNKIDHYAFAYCDKLSSVTLPSGVKTIGVFIFSSCPLIETMSFPASVETMYGCVFSMSGIKTVYFYRTTPPDVGESSTDIFSGCVQQIEHIYVPAGCSGVYKAATDGGWNNSDLIDKITEMQ